MSGSHILAIDQGTTSSRVILIDEAGAPIDSATRTLQQYYPRPGWVEHDPVEIWQGVRALVRTVIERAGGEDRIAAIGITNQRETSVLWDRATGAPLYNAIVWQDRRTADLCQTLRDEGLEEHVRSRTGLVIDPYFSATKLSWLLDHIDDARGRAARGELCFGTVDSWLIWNLTGGQNHLTDVSNAARTMAFDIHKLEWDASILDRLAIPEQVLPKVVPCQGSFGITDASQVGVSLPILGVAGDQQAATFGQTCFAPGMIKSTYGTGCFMLVNSGAAAARSEHKLLTTIAWQREDDITYALEGSIFMAGATMQWLRDNLGLIDDTAQTEALAEAADEEAGVYLVPAFAGMGAPYWDADARAAITGLTRGAGRAEIIRAGLESVAYQSRDLIEAMAGDMAASNLGSPDRIRVDGGMAANNWFLQCLADHLGMPVERARYTETTALGAGYLAGLEAGVFSSLASLKGAWSADRAFEPKMSEDRRESLYAGWQAAVRRVLN